MDFVRAPHGIPGMGEKDTRHVGGGAPQHREFEKAALVDPKAPLIQACEHRANERASRLRKRDDDRIGLAQPGGVAQVALQPERRRSGHEPKQLRRRSPRKIGQGRAAAHIGELAEKMVDALEV